MIERSAQHKKLLLTRLLLWKGFKSNYQNHQFRENYFLSIINLVAIMPQNECLEHYKVLVRWCFTKHRAYTVELCELIFKSELSPDSMINKEIKNYIEEFIESKQKELSLAVFEKDCSCLSKWVKDPAKHLISRVFERIKVFETEFGDAEKRQVLAKLLKIDALDGTDAEKKMLLFKAIATYYTDNANANIFIENSRIWFPLESFLRKNFDIVNRPVLNYSVRSRLKYSDLNRDLISSKSIQEKQSYVHCTLGMFFAKSNPDIPDFENLPIKTYEKLVTEYCKKNKVASAASFAEFRKGCCDLYVSVESDVELKVLQKNAVGEFSL